MAASAEGMRGIIVDRMVVGEHLTFKALVGTASLEADARAAGGSSTSSGDEQEGWFAASRRPAPTEATGALPAIYNDSERWRVLVNHCLQERRWRACCRCNSCSKCE